MRADLNSTAGRAPFFLRALKGLGWFVAWLIALGCSAWAFGALHFDFPILPRVCAWLFALALLAIIVFVRGAWRKLGLTFLGFALVLGWWSTLKPSNDR